MLISQNLLKELAFKGKIIELQLFLHLFFSQRENLLPCPLPVPRELETTAMAPGVFSLSHLGFSTLTQKVCFSVSPPVSGGCCD